MFSFAQWLAHLVRASAFPPHRVGIEHITYDRFVQLKKNYDFLTVEHDKALRENARLKQAIRSMKDVGDEALKDIDLPHSSE